MIHKKGKHDKFYWSSHKNGKKETDDRQNFAVNSYSIHGTLAIIICIFSTGTGSDIIPYNVSFASDPQSALIHVSCATSNARQCMTFTFLFPTYFIYILSMFNISYENSLRPQDLLKIERLAINHGVTVVFLPH